MRSERRFARRTRQGSSTTGRRHQARALRAAGCCERAPLGMARIIRTSEASQINAVRGEWPDMTLASVHSDSTSAAVSATPLLVRKSTTGGMYTAPPGRPTAGGRSKSGDESASSATSRTRRMRYLVTGGAGFIGCNYVNRLLARGDGVTLYDNLSRPGIRANVAWLQERHGKSSFRLVLGDVRDCVALADAVSDADVIVHLAGQTAVTLAVKDPRGDFESNAVGTLNVLEAARKRRRPPIVLYASTNKVYGPMSDLNIREEATRWVYADLPFGVPESRPLDFYSPYGCSKGT